MQLHSLKRKHPNYKSTVVGRGGKRGKTSGRGTKGQKARAGHKIRPEWRDIIKKLPKRRGESSSGSLREIQIRPITITLTRLDSGMADGAEVTPKTLVATGLLPRVRGKYPEVKILGGTLTKKIMVKNCTTTPGAEKTITDLGGTVAK